MAEIKDYIDYIPQHSSSIMLDLLYDRISELVTEIEKLKENYNNLDKTVNKLKLRLLSYEEKKTIK